MARAARFEHGGVDAAAIVHEPQPQFVARVDDFDLDRPCTGMSIGIEQCLAADAEQLVAHDGVQRLHGTLADDAKRHRMIDGQLGGDLGVGPGEIVAVGG